MSEPFSILVVDDNPPSVETLAAVLDARGFIVHTATSGTKALEILRDYQVDILLTDVKMPDMNGVELFRETKKIRPAITAILMTGYSANEVVQQGLAEGVKAILDKPLDISFLLLLFSTIKRIKSQSQ